MKRSLQKISGVIILLLIGVSLAWAVRNVLPSSQPAAEASMTYHDLIDQGDDYYLQHRYSEALQSFEKAAQKDPEDSLARLRIGQLYQLKNRYSEAEQELLFAEKIDPQNPEILFRLGTIYGRLRYFDDAKEYLENTLAILDEEQTGLRGKVYAELGADYLWLSRFDEAESAFQKALDTDPDNQTVRHFLGLLTARHDLSAGRNMLEPNAQSGEETILKQKSQRAQLSLDEILETDDSLIRRLQYGILYIEQGMPTLALDYLKQVGIDQPDYQSAHYYLGYAYFLVGDIARSLEELESSLEMGSGPDQMAYYYLGKVYAYQQEWAEAVEAFERSADLANHSFDLYYSLGQALRQQGEYSKAAKSFRKALEVEPQNLQARTSLVYVLLSYLKDNEEAVRVAEVGVDLDETQAQSHNLLGWALIESGDQSRAEAELREALSLEPELAAAYLNLGTLYESRNSIAQAREAYQQALDLDMEGDIAPLADKALDRLYR